MQSACTALLFAYFTSTDELQYAFSRDGLTFTPLNHGAPVLNCTRDSLRDPFLSRAQGGAAPGFFLVATNSKGFGGTRTILTWASPDLVRWGPEVEAEVMAPQFFPPNSTVEDTWAPEFVWDASAGKHLVFWAARGSGIAPPLDGCAGTNAARFVFFGAHTADFSAFEAPFPLFDPGCAFEGVGGIDGNLVFDPARSLWVLSYKDARGDGEGHGPEELRGVRMVTSRYLGGPWLAATVSALVVPPLVEAPELVLDTPAGIAGPLLYYDCSFFPTPPGYPRPPYGVARGAGGSSAGAFAPLPGACVGNASGAAVVDFPRGATHGSFLCITEVELAKLLEAFPA